MSLAYGEAAGCRRHRHYPQMIGRKSPRAERRVATLRDCRDGTKREMSHAMPRHLHRGTATHYASAG